MMVKYWLLVCAALFLGIAIKEPVIFNIVYMLLFLIFLTIFKVSVKLADIALLISSVSRR